MARRRRTCKKEFEYCTALCMERGLFSGQSHFQAHAADAALGLGDNALFHRHIKESTLSFESSRGGCCTPVLYSLKAIDDVWERDIASAVRSLKMLIFLSHREEKAGAPFMKCQKRMS